MTDDSHQDGASHPDIEVLPTPNPDAAMFRVPEALVFRGTHEYGSPEEAHDSPLARRLFEVEGVTGVLIARQFVTVTRAPGLEWNDFAPLVKEALAEFLQSGQMAVQTTGEGETASTEYSEVEQRIMDLLEERIRPALAADGGDVEYVGFDDGVVRLRLAGACGSCPHATATLAYGIQHYLTEAIPEVKSVERVM